MVAVSRLLFASVRGSIGTTSPSRSASRAAKLKILDANLPADPKLLGVFTKLVGEDFVDLQWNDKVKTPLGDARFIQQLPDGYIVVEVTSLKEGGQYTFAPEQIRFISGNRPLVDPGGRVSGRGAISEDNPFANQDWTAGAVSEPCANTNHDSCEDKQCDCWCHHKSESLDSYCTNCKRPIRITPGQNPKVIHVNPGDEEACQQKLQQRLAADPEYQQWLKSNLGQVRS